MGELIRGPLGGEAARLMGRKLAPARAADPPAPPPADDERDPRPVSRGDLPRQPVNLGKGPRDVPDDLLADIRVLRDKADADLKAGHYEDAACRLEALCDLYSRLGDHMEAFRLLEKSADIMYEHVGVVDVGCVMGADQMLAQAQAARPKDKSLAATRQAFESKWQGVVKDLWHRHKVPAPLPIEWRDAMEHPAWQVALQDAKGLRAAQRRLEQEGRNAIDRSQDLIRKGQAQAAVKTKQMGAEILRKANKDLQAGVAFLETAQLAYERLDVISPELFLKAERSLREAEARPATAAEARKQLDRLNQTVKGMLDQLWREWKIPTSRPATWQEALQKDSLYPYFYDAHGKKEAAHRAAEADAARAGKGSRKSVWEIALDTARTLGGVISDNAEKYLVDPVKVAYDYYTDPAQRQHFWRDAGLAAEVVGSGLAKAGKVAASPLEEAYRYYTDPGFTLKQYARDMKSLGANIHEWVEGGQILPPIPVIRNRAPVSAAHMERLVLAATGQVTSRNRLQLLVDGKEAMSGVMDLIQEAEKSINIQMFMFHNDRSGYEVADALIAKAKQGVKVRVLYDKLGTWLVNSAVASTPGSKGNIVDYLRENGVEVLAEKNTDLEADHTKLIVVDGKSAITGGMNFGNHYTYEWHDFMIRVDGPAVADMQRAFVDSWQKAQGRGQLSDFPKDQYFPPERAMRVMDGVRSATHFTGPNTRQIKDAMFAAIRNARHHINVEHGYLTDEEFVNELIAARRRGVDVRVILPVKSDSVVYERANLVSLNKLVKHGVSVFVYNRTIHGKVMTVDGVWGTIGSANASRRSLNANQELNVAISDPDYIRHIDRRIFEVDMNKDRAQPVWVPIERDTWDSILDWAARHASQMADLPKELRENLQPQPRIIENYDALPEDKRRQVYGDETALA